MHPCTVVNGTSTFMEYCGHIVMYHMSLPMYSLATIPLINDLGTFENVKQVWYADDASASGSILHLRSWWNHLLEIGPGYGYFVNSNKSWLVVKSDSLSFAKDLFRDTDVNVTADGHPHLGVPLGTRSYVEQFISEKVNQWDTILTSLSEIVVNQLHAAYAAFTHGLAGKWMFLSRTVFGIGHLLTPLEVTIRTKFISAITGRDPPSDCLRDLFALPARLGITPPNCLDIEYENSRRVCYPLSSQLLLSVLDYSYEVFSEQMLIRNSIRSERHAAHMAHASSVKDNLPDDLQFVVTLAQERGASSWLTSLPIKEHGFTLHKGDFRDALALRYGWTPVRSPSECSCGSSFSVEHSLSCPKGGFPTIRHNEIRDLSAGLLSEVCNDVGIEPVLQPLQGEKFRHKSAIMDEDARLDFVARGFWQGRNERSFFDIRIFNPHAPTNKKSSLSSIYKCHENMKKRAYAQRIVDVEHSSFTPVVLSVSGGLGREATQFYKRLASLLSTKWDQPYSTTISWLRCCLSFSLLRSSIMCIRGARSTKGFFNKCDLSRKNPSYAFLISLSLKSCQAAILYKMPTSFGNQEEQ